MGYILDAPQSSPGLERRASRLWTQFGKSAPLATCCVTLDQPDRLSEIYFCLWKVGVSFLLYFILFFKKILLIYLSERDREHEQREQQAEGEGGRRLPAEQGAQRGARSEPEPKADTF